MKIINNNEEKNYLYKNSPYLIEQNFLKSMGKDDFKKLIDMFLVRYNRIKIPYNLKLKKIKKQNEYINWNEIVKIFLEEIHYTFCWWNELEKRKRELNKLQNYFKLNHTNFMKKNNYVQIDVNSTPIEQIISLYINIPTNLNRNIRCPFISHRDTNSSFRIYKNTNSFICFGCWKRWNAINFISYMENISNSQAFKKFIQIIK